MSPAQPVSLEPPVPMHNRRRARLRALALAALILCAALLGAGNVIYAALSSEEPRHSGAPGDLLYVAAFSDAGADWDLYDGPQSTLIVDEQLELAARSPQTATWTTARGAFADFDLRVAARAVAGPIDNAFGVLFRARDASEPLCDLPALLLCGIEELSPLLGAAMRQAFDTALMPRYFAFLISSDGYYSLWKAQSGKTTQISAWIPAAQIQQGLGAINIIRVIGRGDSYRFAINHSPVALCLPRDANGSSTFAGGKCIDGELRDHYRDDALRGGRVGLIAQSTATGGAGVSVRFDNLIVFSPGGSEDSKL